MQNIVSVYPTRAKAEQVRETLIDSGVPEADIQLSAEDGTTGESRPKSFWDFLFGSSLPDDERDWYATNLREGRTAVSVRLQHAESHERVAEILHGHEPIELPRRDADQGIGATAAGVEKIPIVKEQLEVGKRQTEKRYRVRVYAVEQPVEETVNLRDEKVVIERRPVAAGEAGPATVGTEPREFEVVERHEEAVAAKTARVTEEVVVHKEVDERTEVVRDKVKETRVDVDKGGQPDRR
jgi:stress response protein YsnF